MPHFNTYGYLLYDKNSFETVSQRTSNAVSVAGGNQRGKLYKIKNQRHCFM